MDSEEEILNGIEEKQTLYNLIIYSSFKIIIVKKLHTNYDSESVLFGFGLTGFILLIIALLCGALQAQTAMIPPTYTIPDTFDRNIKLSYQDTFDAVINNDSLLYIVDIEYNGLDYKAEAEGLIWRKLPEYMKLDWCQRFVMEVLTQEQIKDIKVYNYLAANAKYAVYEMNRTRYDATLPIDNKQFKTSANGILASGTLAQALLETNNGLSKLCSTHNNHFGIKCHGWKKKSTWHKDDHYKKINGVRTKVPSCFRAYKNSYESFKDHSTFLLANGRYKKVCLSTNWKDYCYLIGKSGYATGANYGGKLATLVSKYRLDLFDKGIYDAHYLKNEETKKKFRERETSASWK